MLAKVERWNGGGGGEGENKRIFCLMLPGVFITNWIEVGIIEYTGLGGLEDFLLLTLNLGNRLS